jgi:hypothetical protein
MKHDRCRIRYRFFVRHLAHPWSAALLIFRATNIAQKINDMSVRHSLPICQHMHLADNAATADAHQVKLLAAKGFAACVFC